MATKSYAIERIINPKHETRNSKQSQITNFKCSKQERLEVSNFENLNLFRISIFEFRILELQSLFGSPASRGSGLYSPGFPAVAHVPEEVLEFRGDDEVIPDEPQVLFFHTPDSLVHHLQHLTDDRGVDVA